MDTHPTWDWSSVGDSSAAQQTQPERQPEPETSQSTSPRQPDATPRAEPRASSRNKHYGPRTCRICLDTEEPRFPTATTTFGIPTSSSRPTYASDDPELGRLLSPCKCKGSQKYVHEGCLSAWRLANPMEARNYWQCPTCKFSYRISRLHWSSTLSSKWAQIGLTFVFCILSIFVLGFIADPLFDLWSDPIGTIGETVTSVVTDIEAMRTPPHQEPTSWIEHFIKGFFSLGIVGLFKTMVTVNPFHWWQLRNSGIAGGGRRQGTGRNRVENINLIFVLIGAFTFLMGIWKAVQKLSARVLKNVSDRVLDVGEDDDDDEGVNDGPSQESKKDQ
ncbi:RING finger domain [Fusarium albosuccineum]|uniref:RING finger domain n=1 Tax=Fusarium albosuccineum TaxID=1237068 RepID=A0A8H4LAD7_9HYPO|nr:RING finger domain [Fusarium albosuccineum]